MNSNNSSHSSNLSSLSDSMSLDVLESYCDDLHEILDAWVNNTNCEVTPSMSNIVFSFYGLAHDATHGEVDKELALKTILSILDIIHLETMYHYNESNQDLHDKITQLHNKINKY